MIHARHTLVIGLALAPLAACGDASDGAGPTAGSYATQDGGNKAGSGGSSQSDAGKNLGSGGSLVSADAGTGGSAFGGSPDAGEGSRDAGTGGGSLDAATGNPPHGELDAAAPVEETPSCEEEKVLFKVINPDFCDPPQGNPPVAQTSFTLKSKSVVQRIDIYAHVGSTTSYTVSSGGTPIMTGTMKWKGPGPHPDWGFYYTDEDLGELLEAGKYQVKVGGAIICNNPASGGHGFIIVHGCEALIGM